MTDAPGVSPGKGVLMRRYARLNGDGTICYAPNGYLALPSGATVLAPSADAYAAEGYLPVDGVSESGKWAASGGSLVPVPAAEGPRPASWTVSKYRLARSLAAAGKLTEFIAVIDADRSLRFLWDAAQELDTADEAFGRGLDAACAALGVSRDAAMDVLWEARA